MKEQARRERKLQAMAMRTIHKIPVVKVYPYYVAKAERKGRSKEELDEIIFWLTGHDEKSFAKVLESELDFQTFFDMAPSMNPNRSLITGVICGVRVEEIEDRITREGRYLDKLVDELAKGKSMDKILRKPA